MPNNSRSLGGTVDALEREPLDSKVLRSLSLDPGVFVRLNWTCMGTRGLGKLRLFEMQLWNQVLVGLQRGAWRGNSSQVVIDDVMAPLSLPWETRRLHITKKEAPRFLSQWIERVLPGEAQASLPARAPRAPDVFFPAQDACSADCGPGLLRTAAQGCFQGHRFWSVGFSGEGGSYPSCVVRSLRFETTGQPSPCKTASHRCVKRNRWRLGVRPVLGIDGRPESNFGLAGISVLICEARPERQPAGCNTSPTTSNRQTCPHGALPVVLCHPPHSMPVSAPSSRLEPVISLLLHNPSRACCKKGQRDWRAPQRNGSGATPGQSLVCSWLRSCHYQSLESAQSSLPLVAKEGIFPRDGRRRS